MAVGVQERKQGEKTSPLTTLSYEIETSKTWGGREGTLLLLLLPFLPSLPLVAAASHAATRHWFA